MFWLTTLVVLYSMGKKYNCSSEVRGLGDVKIHAAHCHYTTKPAELPPLWLSSGKEAGKAISSYGQVHSTWVQNQLVVGSNSQIYPSNMPGGFNTSTEAVAAAALLYIKTTVDFQPKRVLIHKCKSDRHQPKSVSFKNRCGPI